MHFVYFTLRSSRLVLRRRAMQPIVNFSCLISSQSLRACAPAHVIHHVEQKAAQTNGASALCRASTLLHAAAAAAGGPGSTPTRREEGWGGDPEVDLQHCPSFMFKKGLKPSRGFCEDTIKNSWMETTTHKQKCVACTLVPGVSGVALWDGGQSGGLGDSRLYVELITKCCDLQLGLSLPERSHLLMARPNPQMEACLMDYYTSSMLLPLRLWAAASSQRHKHTHAHTHSYTPSQRQWLVTVLRAWWLLWMILDGSIVEYFLHFTSDVSHLHFAGLNYSILSEYIHC